MTAVPASLSPLSADWRDLASLGEQIAASTSLAAQRDRIVAMTSRLLEGEVDVWLHENLFRLPGSEEEASFSKEPDSPAMQRALRKGQLLTRQ